MTPRRDLAGPRGRPAIAANVLLVVGILIVAACSSGGSGSASGRPTTPATLQIVAPAPNAVTGPNVGLKLQLAHAHLDSPTQLGGKIRPDRGHIHVSVDGTLVAMSFGLDQALPDLKPGVHTIQAEFVASDHLPFKNRVVAAVTFRVS